MVSLDQTVRIRGASCLRGGGVVDDVATERRDLKIADHFSVRRARLGELTGYPADLHDRDADRVGENDGHLQDDFELLSDVVGRELFEALGAVAGLQEERIASRNLCEFGLQRTCFSCKDERWQCRDLLQRRVKCTQVRP